MWSGRNRSQKSEDRRQKTEKLLRQHLLWNRTAYGLQRDSPPYPPLVRGGENRETRFNNLSVSEMLHFFCKTLKRQHVSPPLTKGGGG